MRNPGAFAAILSASLALSGCYRYLAHQFVVPDHFRIDGINSKADLDKLGTRYQYFTTPASVRLAYLVLEPGDYGFTYQSHQDKNGLEFKFHFEPVRRSKLAVKGTILFIHGWGMDATSMLLWGVEAAQHGYRALLVDLRSNGRSSRAPVGYGTRESDDIAALVAALRAQGAVVEPLVLFGESYGADVALYASNKLPNLPAVVALEPFDNVADALRSASAALAKGWQKILLRPHTVEHAIDTASAELKLDLRALDAEAQVSASPSCLLFIHGQQDRIVPVENSRTLVKFNARAQLYEYPRSGHFSTPMRIDVLGPPILDWIGRLNREKRCPRFEIDVSKSVQAGEVDSPQMQ